ncbi:hypothetical protein L1987_12851 [Smallanthus sonchifolius]|uniref:Uncharacterized protein n=1 Tax=Smallanthus sonchifolius TaxID=185202 RepID=A0ACB9JFB9_9ASTR|nr:hypothetical protein L1987_12851 [Smallanthus sonchifolius]
MLNLYTNLARQRSRKKIFREVLKLVEKNTMKKSLNQTKKHGIASSSSKKRKQVHEDAVNNDDSRAANTKGKCV